MIIVMRMKKVKRAVPTTSQSRLSCLILNSGFFSIALLVLVLGVLPWSNIYSSLSHDASSAIQNSTTCTFTGSHDIQHYVGGKCCVSKNLTHYKPLTITESPRIKHGSSFVVAILPTWLKNPVTPGKLSYSSNASTAFSFVPIYLLIERFLN